MIVPPSTVTVTFPLTYGVVLLVSPCPPPKTLPTVPDLTVTFVVVLVAVLVAVSPLTVPRALPPYTLPVIDGVFPPPVVPIVISTLLLTNVWAPCPPP